MKGYWDNLRPLEKRMVVGIAVMFFIILNFWFVVPHFSDMGRVQQRMFKAQKLLSTFQNEIKQKSKYDEGIKRLQGQESEPIPLEDQAGAFQDTIRSQADMNHVRILQFGRVIPRTNDQFFWEQTATITVVSKEQNLVDFLYNLGSGGSLVRVRDLTLRPDQPAQQELNAGIKLVASYQKKAPAKTSTPAKPAQPAPIPKTQPAPAGTQPAPVSTPPPPPFRKNAAPATKTPSPTDKPPASTRKQS